MPKRPCTLKEEEEDHFSTLTIHKLNATYPFVWHSKIIIDIQTNLKRKNNITICNTFTCYAFKIIEDRKVNHDKNKSFCQDADEPRVNNIKRDLY